MFSAKLGREVQRSEAVDAPPSELIEPLHAAWDFPIDRDGNKRGRGSVPPFFRSWAPTAWRDVMDSLSDEENTAEVVESAAEQFKNAVAGALLTLEAFSYKYKADSGEERSEVQRRSLLSWAQMFAKPGNWDKVRTLSLWSKKDKSGAVCIAMHVSLFGQLRRPDLAKWNHRKFTQFCEMYGVGVSSKAGRSRAVVLCPEFIADLLAGPVDGDVDGEVDGHAFPGKENSCKRCASTSPSTLPST
jgi:hypothetical protein